MMRTVITYMCLLVAILLGCSRGPVTEEELLHYPLATDHGLIKSLSDGNISITIQYQPKDLIIVREFESSNRNQTMVDSVYEALKPYDYFILRIAMNGEEVTNTLAKEPAIYTNAQNYLSFGIGNDCRIIHDRDTIYVEDFIQTKTYGMAKAATIMLVFRSSLTDKNGVFQFLLNDKFFGTGVNTAQFKTEDLRSIPRLKF